MKKRECLNAIIIMILLFSFSGNLESSAKEYRLNTRSFYDFNTIHYKSDRNNDYDHDFYQYMSFTSEGYGVDNLSTYVSMRYEKDLDGTRRRDYFRDITDTYNGDNQLKVYNANAKLSDLLGKFDVTVGRQYFYGAEITHFDGGRIDFERTGPVDMSFFGGRRVTFYEYPERWEIWGGNFSIYPVDGTKVAVRMVKYIDLSNDFSIYQTITPEIDFSGTYSLINNDPRDLALDLSYNSYEGGTTALVSFYRKLGGSSADDFDFNYTSSHNKGKRGLEVTRLHIGDLTPYQDYYIQLHKRILGGFGIGVSYTKRHLLNNNEGDQYNNSFDELTAGVDWYDFFVPGTDMLFNWRHFKNERHTKHFESQYNIFEGQLAHKINDKFFIDAGTFYRFYDYNNKNIGTFGFSGDIRAYLTQNIDFKIRYAYEEDDPVALTFSEIDYIQNITIELGFRF